MFPDRMTPLLTETGVFWGLVGVSVVGTGAALFCWRRRFGTIGTGLAVLAALAWPLWEFFGALDRWLDVTTIVGMAAPYVVFVMIGAGIGLALSSAERKARPAEPVQPGGEGEPAAAPEI